MNPLRYAARSLVRRRGFSITTIATIALGIGAGCAVFGLVNTILLRPLPYRDADRLVGVWHSMSGLGSVTGKQAPGTYELYSENAKSFDGMGLYVSLAATLTYASPDLAPERVRAGWMTGSVFTLLGIKPILGRPFRDEDGTKSATPVVVISERLWRARFGADRNVLDRTLDVDGVRRRIIGVMPAAFVFPESNVPVWAPLDPTPAQYVGGFGFNEIGRLHTGVTADVAQRELERLLVRLPDRYAELRPGVSTAVGLRQTKLTPLVHSMRDDVVAGFERVLWLIAGTVALLVIVAFSNVASLLLVHVEARQREFAVRSALGASAWGVWQSLMAEALIVAVIGGALGLAIAATALQTLVSIGPADLPRLNEVHVDASIVIVAITLTALFAVMSAVIGAARIRSKDAMRILRDGGRAGTSGRSAQRMRAAFVVVEVALSLVLLAGSGVLGRSVIKLRAVQPGFDPSNTFTFWTFLPGVNYKSAGDAARFYREAIDRMQRIPGVVSVAATAKLPLEIEGFPYQILIWADDGSNTSTTLPPIFQATTTTSGYFNTMRIPLIAGRSYDDAGIRRGANEAVASRAFVERFWHDETGAIGVGKRIRPNPNGAWYTIVGVVGDVRDSTLTLPPVAEVYFPEEHADLAAPAPNVQPTNTTARDMAFVVRTRGPMPGLARSLERELHAMDANLPFYRPAAMEQIVTDARSRMTFALLLLTVGAAATLALGVVGLYGVIAYVVSLRTREISIRIALGLPPASAAWMILKQGEAIVAAGALVGVCVFLLFAKLIGSLAFEVNAADGAALLGATVLVVAVASIATWLPARRAASFDPAQALKGE